MTTSWYDWKFVCRACGAIHYYRPAECKRCGSVRLEKHPNGRKAVASVKSNDKELRVEIDQNRLEDEWQDQPVQMHYWSVKVAEYQRKYDEAKREAVLIAAECAKDVRANPSDYDLDKVTEKAIEAVVPTCPEVRAADKDVIDARYELQVAQAAVTALEHRKRALSMLVELWTKDYYSSPRMPDNTEATEEYSKQEVRSRGLRRRRMDEEDDDEDLDD